ncbi:MAG: class I SAM-dependent methyltransferase [Halobacteriales archaeon]|nr:class I SAM-dependent methyltransferase [Halobacteriales archaeon]
MSKTARVTGFYGRWARLYDLLASQTPGIGSLRTRAAAACRLDPGDTVVEMGCGTGANFPYLREAVGASGTVIGADLTPGMLHRARARIERAGWVNVHLMQGDATQPPIDTEIDAILATFVVGMFDDPESAVARWCELLAPDGRLALLDATRSDRASMRPFNAAFRGFVTATTPPGWKLRYDRSPTDALDERVTQARKTLADRGTIDLDRRFALGYLRLTAGSSQA